MSFFDSALAFIEGIKSVIDISGAVQGNLSDAISNGIERAFKRIKKPLEQSLMKVSIVFVSVFFMVWGLALFMDNFVPYRGLGFVVVGALLGLAAFLFLQEKESQ
jgi:hypothetical protein